jgi:hypothetical protein
MDVTQEEALSLLRKWHEDKYLIQGSLLFGKTRCMFFGHIREIDDQIWIDGSSREQLGDRYGLILRLADVLRFSFEDTRFFAQLAPGLDPSLSEQVEQSYESILMLDLGPCQCAMFASSDSGVLPT